MKARLLAACALLASCGQEPQPDPRSGAMPMATAGEADQRIECAIAGAQAFERACLIERLASPEGLTLTIRAPDGGFRRLLVTKDGRGVVAADGALPAIVTVIGDKRIEVAIGGDRYRLPATVK